VIGTRYARRRSASDSGLTLVELLVALALAALTMALLPGALRLGYRAWEAQGELEHASEASLALHAIEQRLAAALPVYEVEAESRAFSLVFRGTASMLEFVAATESGPAGGGLYRWRLTPAKADGTGLSLLIAPYAPGGAATPGETRVLSRAGSAVRFRYLGLASTEAREAQWQESWTRADAMPIAVEIRLEAAPESRVAARRVVVALRLAARGPVRTP
jgi:general secretion pathway protein J